MTLSVKYRRNSPVIHSGGQTGVDRAALDFALCHNISCSGWCAPGRMAEDGPINLRYPLRPVYGSNNDLRTELNVVDCDATLIICFDEMDRGTNITIEMTSIHNKPLFVWKLDSADASAEVRKIKKWLNKYQVKHLNIAGPRESNARGIYERTLESLQMLLLED